MDIDAIAFGIVIGLIAVAVLAIFFAIWCMCAAASQADRWSERYWDETENSKRKKV